MKEKTSPIIAPALLILGILIVFIARSLLAARFNVPRLFSIFDALTVAGCVLILLKGYSHLKPGDWVLAAVLGVLVGVGMYFATLFSPYPFFEWVHTHLGHAWLRGIFTFIATLGGLAIMRQGGPVLFHAANRQMGRSGRDILFGLLIGLPLAVLNVFALQFTQRQAISWQSPLAALADALQPAIVEEVIYRFALWGIFWMILRAASFDKAVWLSGALALLVHNYSHYDDLFVQSPLTAIGFGLVVLIFWGLPPTLLARYRGLESAVAFHWVQDVARFVAGF